MDFGIDVIVPVMELFKTYFLTEITFFGVNLMVMDFYIFAMVGSILIVLLNSFGGFWSFGNDVFDHVNKKE